MQKPTLQLIIEKWIGAFNEHDVNKLLSLYHPNARHYSSRVETDKPETKGWLTGKNQLREWWQQSFDKLPDLNYKLKEITAEEHRIFIEYERRASSQPDSEVMEYLRIQNRLIMESRVLRSWPLDQNRNP